MILIIVFVAGLVVGVALAIPQLRRIVREKVWPQVRSAVRNIWGILTTPRQLFTTYLPPIWGSHAMKYLIREGYL